MIVSDTYLFALASGALLLFIGIMAWAFHGKHGRPTGKATRKKHGKARRIDMRHLTAALAGVVCFALVFLYTGDSDFLAAISSGLAAGALWYIIAGISFALRKSSGRPKAEARHRSI